MKQNDKTNRVEIPENFFVRVRKSTLISMVFLFVSVIVNGQSTTVFIDNFDRGTSSAFPGPGGTPVVNWTSFSTLDPPANIVTWGAAVGRVLQIFGTNTTASTGSPGRSYVVGTLSDFHPLFKSKLNENLADVTWTFNWRNNRSGSSLNGFNLGNSNYGQAVVLAATSSDLMTASGYAVTLLGTGSTTTSQRTVQIVRFENGLVSNTNITNIVASTAGTLLNLNYSSVKVVYNPSTDTWSLSLRSDAGEPLDPMIEDETLGYYTFVGSAVDDTYTDVSMTSCGFFYNHGITSTNSNAKAMYDNFGVRVAAEALSIDASLSDLSVSQDAVNYTTLMRFDPATKDYYQYYVTKNTHPLVNAVANDENATVDIVQAVNLRGTAEERKATITVTAEDTNVTDVYTIEFVETEYVYLTGLGSNGGGGSSSNGPAGWSYGGSFYYTNTLANGNNKYEGLAAYRLGTTSEFSWFALPKMKGIGTLSFYARKYESSVEGSIAVSVRKATEEEWTQVYSFGDIDNLNYQEFTVAINQQHNDSMYVRIETIKNAPGSYGYYFDDVAYTAYPGPGTDYTPELSREYRVRSIKSGFAIDVEHARVEIYNSIGMLQQSADINGTHQFIMNNPGMYIIRISMENEHTSTKYLVR